MILNIIIAVVCLFIGARVSPAIKKSNGVYFLHYNARRGVRNKVKLF